MKFPVLGLTSLTYPVRPALPHPDFPPNSSMLTRMAQGDVLLHTPYHAFDYVIDLLREAAIDPRVESIRMTLSRRSQSTTCTKKSQGLASWVMS